MSLQPSYNPEDPFKYNPDGTIKEEHAELMRILDLEISNLEKSIEDKNARITRAVDKLVSLGVDIMSPSQQVQGFPIRCIQSYCCHFIDGPLKLAASAIGLQDWTEYFHIYDNDANIEAPATAEKGTSTGIHRYVKREDIWIAPHNSHRTAKQCVAYQYGATVAGIKSNAQGFHEAEK